MQVGEQQPDREVAAYSGTSKRRAHLAAIRRQRPGSYDRRRYGPAGGQGGRGENAPRRRPAVDSEPAACRLDENVLRPQGREEWPPWLLRSVRGYVARRSWFTEEDVDALAATLGVISKSSRSTLSMRSPGRGSAGWRSPTRRRDAVPATSAVQGRRRYSTSPDYGKRPP